MTNLEKYHNEIEHLVMQGYSIVGAVKQLEYNYLNKNNSSHEEVYNWLSSEYYMTTYFELNEFFDNHSVRFCDGLFGETGEGNIFIIMGGQIIFEDGSHDYLTNYIGWDFSNMEDEDNDRDKSIEAFKNYITSYGIIKLITKCDDFSDYKQNPHKGRIFFELNKELYFLNKE